MREQDRTRGLPVESYEKSRTRAQPNAKERSGSAANPGFDLQRTAGNQAVVNLFESGAIQAKLRVSQPGDTDEVEADRIADQVTVNSAASVESAASGTIHRKCDCPGGAASCPACEEEQVEQTKGIHRKSSEPSQGELSVRDDFLHSLGPGQALEPAVRKSMESRLGGGFGNVKVHADSQAASSAKSINARAFTAGDHIVFGEGQYAPHSSSGIRLLAHELAHTVQNRNCSGAQSFPSAPGAAIKRDSLVGKASAWLGEKTAGAGKWIDEKKWAIYRAMIAGLKNQKGAGIALMRSMVPKLPASLQSAASTIIDVADFVVDLEIALLLAIIGLAVGFVEGIVGLIVGLIKLAVGLIKMVIDLLVALMGRPDEFTQDLRDLVEAIKGIPPGLTKIKDEWLERYRHATLEEQVLMGGELVGQVEAFIATFALAGTKAGQATTLTVRTGGTVTKVAAQTGIKVLQEAPAVAVTIPAVVPKTAAEAAVVTSQMMMSSSGPGAAGLAGRGGSGGTGKSTTPEPKKGSEGDQPSKTEPASSEEARLQQKYGSRSKTTYPVNEWRRIEQLEERFPKLKEAKLRPVRRPATGGEALFEERMQTTQSGYGLAGYSSDGQQVIQFDGISPDGFIEEIKIQQSEGSIDDIMAQLRRQADFARDYGLKGVEYSVQPPTMADAVEARVAEEHLRNVYPAR